jgi:hypothetical protein
VSVCNKILLPKRRIDIEVFKTEYFTDKSMVSKMQQTEQLLGSISGRFPEKKKHPVSLESQN